LGLGREADYVTGRSIPELAGLGNLGDREQQADHAGSIDLADVHVLA
jgi:hypothetical protein